MWIFFQNHGVVLGFQRLKDGSLLGVYLLGLIHVHIYSSIQLCSHQPYQQQKDLISLYNSRRI